MDVPRQFRNVVPPYIISDCLKPKLFSYVLLCWGSMLAAALHLEPSTLMRSYFFAVCAIGY